jgi:hypothetical protein
MMKAERSSMTNRYTKIKLTNTKRRSLTSGKDYLMLRSTKLFMKKSKSERIKEKRWTLNRGHRKRSRREKNYNL